MTPGQCGCCSEPREPDLDAERSLMASFRTAASHCSTWLEGQGASCSGEARGVPVGMCQVCAAELLTSAAILTAAPQLGT